MGIFFMKLKSWQTYFIIGATAMSSLFGVELAAAQGTHDAMLSLDSAKFTVVNIKLDGKPTTLRRYDAAYAGQPVAMATEQPARGMGPGGSPTKAKTQVLADMLAFQRLAIFVPDNASDAAAMILNVNNGGWFASELKTDIVEGGTYVSNSDTDKAGAALAAGYVYVDVGSRGRGIVGAVGNFPGKAPAAVVDTKAAIRFLRLNDAALPGSAERIIITGISGGGGLSSVVAASGNSADYYPLLAEIGAAGISADGTSSLNDDVFAVIAYCPITDLGNADMAYEWLFRGTRVVQNTVDGNWSAAGQAASKELAAAYPAYLAGLGLKLEGGQALTVDTMKSAIAAEVQREVERHLAGGGTVPALGKAFEIKVHQGPKEVEIKVENKWLDVENGVIKSFDFDAFLSFVAQTSALKAVPAFDRTANTGNKGMDGENSLFGKAIVPYANFSAFGWNHNDVAGDGSGADDTGLDWQGYTQGTGAELAQQVRLINPMDYLGTSAKAAPYWYVRHGMIDRDTSFAVEVALATAARQDADVKGVDFRLPWLTSHSGDYDVKEAYSWLAEVLSAAGPLEK